MNETKNYTGRTVDFLVFQGTAPRGERKLSMGFGSATGGAVTTGVQKLAQLWALLFLTEQGSILSAPLLGTAFIFLLRIGAIQDESDVQTEFSSAARDVLDQLHDRENGSDLVVPDDEKILSAVLLSFMFNRPASTLSLKVGLTSLAGTKHDIFLPIPVPIE